MASLTVCKPLFTAVWAAADPTMGHYGKLTKAQEDRWGKFGLNINHYFYRTGFAHVLGEQREGQILVPFSVTPLGLSF